MTIANRGLRDYDEMGCNGYYSFLTTLTKNTDENKVVKMASAHTVALCDDGDAFAGVVRTIDTAGDICGVQLDGCVTLAGTGISVGFQPLLARTGGGVKVNGSPATGSKYFEVLETNATDGTVTFKL